MRLKTFTADTMNDAMALVKEHFGEDAIIVSTQTGEGGSGVRITAAIDQVEDEYGFEEDVYEDELYHDPIEIITDALLTNGVPPQLSDDLIATAEEMALEDPVLALAGAVDRYFSFSPMPLGTAEKPILLVGMPGAGKTVTIAKLATKIVMQKQPVRVITTDTVRAGGFAQLEAFTKILKLNLISAGTPEELRAAVKGAEGRGHVLIDCPGGNPFDDQDIARQARLIKAVDADVVLVMAGGTDPMEAAEIAAIYRELGARRLLLTRIDMTRRFGSYLSAAAVADLMLTDVGVGPSVADGLRPMNPVTLARLLLPHSVVQDFDDEQPEARGAYG
ncbi:hypothetical protein NUH88_02230 [Nisaea acidiphila]|uniref:Flagellar biosynthesis protein FlhF n=1 Tax=Nisaea acidiphila TaxID=1862145 RepID=A0A9J7AYK7_9PROT|nr:hypothetical protein [Nisaea acidiphila]UUX50517.1 hypothetical protein NUH88_02230 [Nisaea acidiphila]